MFEVHIEFGESQLSVRTDDPEVYDFLRDWYEFMLVPRVSASLGVLEVPKTAYGHDFRRSAAGAARQELAGSAPGQPQEARALEPELIPILKREIADIFLAARPDLLWLHAGAVERDGAALIVAGAPGQGKSTLTTMLSSSGWSFMSDEITAVDCESNLALPFPQTAMRRVPTNVVLPPKLVDSLTRERVAMRPNQIRRDPAPIELLVFISFRANSRPRLKRLSKGDGALRLVESSTSFNFQRVAALKQAGSLASTIPAYRLTYGDSAGALRELAMIL